MSNKYQPRRVMRRAKIKALQPLARAVMVVSSIAVLATGVTYAALQSQSATLTGNSFSTATADLRIGTTASTFYSTRTGFNFTNVVPGAVPLPTEGSTFYLKNYSPGPMSLKVAISGQPVSVSNNIDMTKVYMVFTRVDSGASNKFSLNNLQVASTSGGLAITDILGSNTSAQYKVQVVMDEDAFVGTSANMTGIDLVFTGSIVTAQ